MKDGIRKKIIRNLAYVNMKLYAMYVKRITEFISASNLPESLLTHWRLPSFLNT
jgi:hypothetical protein